MNCVGFTSAHPTRHLTFSVLLTQPVRPLLQFVERAQGLRACSELRCIEYILRSACADTREHAVDSVLIGQISAHRFTVTAAQVGIEQGAGQRPVIDLPCRGK